MRQRFTLPLFIAFALAALVGYATPAVAAAPSIAATTARPSDAVAFPTVDPSYIYDQLAYMVTHFQHREAGYDNNLPVSVNGHDEFAAYWQTEMLNDLQGFGATAQRDAFPVDGWQGRPATVKAFNVEVTVPGQTHADQAVVIGCHYDAEGSSTQSANDDGSGCAIELGVAKALATYWRANHLYPVRTLRFVIYDAEEQGLYGSFHYLNQTINGDIPNITAMINEEQNGIEYPLRYLGSMQYPLMPTTLFVTPLTNNQSYSNTQTFTTAQRADITAFRNLIEQAAPATFSAFRAQGDGSMTYTDTSGKPVSQPIFTTQDLQYVTEKDDNIASSDQYPFSLAGRPTLTIIGNYSYYDRNPPPGSYPYDQPQDTIQLMNIFASGSSNEAPALKLALALPGMVTTWALAQPSVLGFATADGKPLAAISDVGRTSPGKPVSLNASAAYDPARPGANLSYRWNFGDGTPTAQGVAVQHTWAKVGAYTVTLTVSDAGGSRTISKRIQVTTTPPVIANPYAQFPQDGMPPANPAVTLPQDNQNPTGGSSSGTTGGSSSVTTTPLVVVAPPPWWGLALLGVIALLAVGAIVLVLGRLRRRPAPVSGMAPSAAEAERRWREEALRNLYAPPAPDDRPPDPVG